MGAVTAWSHATAIVHPVPPLLACGIRPLIQHASPWGTRGVTGARVALAVRLSGLPLPLPPAAASAAASPLLRPARFLALPSTSLPASQAAVANATHTRGDSSGTRVMAGCSPAGSSGVVVSGERRWWWRRLFLPLRLHGCATLTGTASPLGTLRRAPEHGARKRSKQFVASRLHPAGKPAGTRAGKGRVQRAGVREELSRLHERLMWRRGGAGAS